MIGHITLLKRKHCMFCGRSYKTYLTQKYNVCSNAKCLFAENEFIKKIKEVSQNEVRN